MKLYRWLIFFPGAMLASVIGYILAMALTDLVFGGRLLIGYWCFLPTGINAAIPTVFFVVAAAVLSPAKGRKAVFVFFGLSMLCSAGGMEAVQYGQMLNDPGLLFAGGMLEERLTGAFGVVAGALIGLGIALRLQRWRAPNKSPEATPGQRPPAAPSPSTGAPHL